MWKLLFSAKGKIGRKTYRNGLVIDVVLLFGAYLVFNSVITPMIAGAKLDPETGNYLKIAFVAISLATLFWIYLVLTIKRLHGIGLDYSEVGVVVLPIIGIVLLTWSLLGRNAGRWRRIK